MLSQSLDRDVLDRLHPGAIDDSASVRALLERLRQEGIRLRRGLNRKITPETAFVRELGPDTLLLATKDFDAKQRTQILLNFELDRQPYFFAAAVLEQGEGFLSAELPRSIYRAERRDRLRHDVLSGDAGSPKRVRLRIVDQPNVDAEVADTSASGMGVQIPSTSALSNGLKVGSPVDIEFLDGTRAGSVSRARVCYQHESADNGWKRLGLSLLGTTHRLPTEEVSDSRLTWKKARQAWEIVAAGAAARSDKFVRAVTRRSRATPVIRVLSLENDKGEVIKALVNHDGHAPVRGAPIVLIPPAWGRTKETLLPLAESIVATFAAAGRPVTVVRFDGIRKRGESQNDPGCLEYGKEHHRFTFSQGVDDILAVIGALDRLDEFRPSKYAMVTFSAASVDGRRAAAIDAGRRICGWVCAVGSADLQSMMRVVSGGIDFVGGVERGISFGIQEILGVEVDIDHAGKDALGKSMAFLDDGCRDMEGLRIPVTWIHGRHDAWMDLERVRLMLSSGDMTGRKLVVVPTGHQLRTSREAFDVFQLIATEVGRMCLGEELRPRVPDLGALEARQAEERRRLPVARIDRRAFWRRYLIGKQGSLGIELMTSSSSYRQFMREQTNALGLTSEDRVVDVGSGTGAFGLGLGERPQSEIPRSLHELDYVKEGLVRSRHRREHGPGQVLDVGYLACDLSVDGHRLSIPCKDSSYDAAIASLFISYVEDPVAALREIARVLKPGGRLVVSGLRRDADVSKLFVDAVAEIGRGAGAAALPQLPGSSRIDLDLVSREFLNDATRLLDLEEYGVFSFRDASELTELIAKSGFTIGASWRSFGDPPQAVVVSARKDV